MALDEETGCAVRHVFKIGSLIGVALIRQAWLRKILAGQIASAPRKREICEQARSSGATNALVGNNRAAPDDMQSISPATQQMSDSRHLSPEMSTCRKITRLDTALHRNPRTPHALSERLSEPRYNAQHQQKIDHKGDEVRNDLFVCIVWTRNKSIHAKIEKVPDQDPPKPGDQA